VIDLVAFLPALIIPAAGGGILLRILRLLRLMQILKIKSVRKGIHRVGQALSEAKGDLAVSFSLSIFLIFIGAVCMYFVEGKTQPEVFGSIPRARGQ
jgi:voltage-gated potassium channel